MQLMAQIDRDNRAATRPRGRMRRLLPQYYRGYAFVHWNMTMQDRTTDWLTPAFHLRFREIQLHSLSRYGLLCLCYCLMPDHLHLLWAGLSPDSDQDKAAMFFKKYLNRALAEEAGAGSRAAPDFGTEPLVIDSAGAGSRAAPKTGAEPLPASAGDDWCRPDTDKVAP